MWSIVFTIYQEIGNQRRWIPVWFVQDDRFRSKKKIDRKWTDDLADELHKPKRVNFTRRQVTVSEIDEIWSADLVDMTAFRKYNDEIKFLLTVIDLFSRYAWVVPLESKKGVDIQSAFRSIVKTSSRKPRKLWVDQGTEFYNRTFKHWLDENQITMYSTHNEGKAVVVERFNRTLKTRMWKYFSANSTSRYIDVLPHLVEKYNTTKHRGVRMTPTEASREKNADRIRDSLGEKSPLSRSTKFQIDDHVRLVKQKRHFEKGYTPNWTEEVFRITDILPTRPTTYSVKDLDGESVDGSFYEQELQKTTQEIYRIEKVLRKDNKKKQALVRWKGYSARFDSWVPFDQLSWL